MNINNNIKCIFYACYVGDLELVKYLISMNININQLDFINRNCLF